MDYIKILDQVLVIVRQAGQETLKYYGQTGEITDKGNDSPLTKADLASNEIIINGLKRFGAPILSEEGVDNKERLRSDLAWIIDPLDGTKDFIQETGEFTIMIALVKRQGNNIYRPVLSAIYRPAADIIYSAVINKGAFVRHDEEAARMIRVSPESEWHNLVMLTSRNHTTDLEQEIADKLGIPKIIACGSSLKACLIAEGEGHVNFNIAPHTWEWDVCASDLIVHEAGGRFTDAKGELISYNKDNPKNLNGYVITNGLIHDEIIKQIKESS